VQSHHHGKRGFWLGDWLVQPALSRVTDSSGEVQLEPRAMDLLVYLAENACDVVSRQQIIDAVWQQEFVGDATVSGTIAKLRRALGDDARSPRYIETIPKRGYRLLPQPVDVLEVAARPGGAFRVGEWFVEPSLNRMSKGDATVELEQSMMDVLLCLAERAGEPVPRHELVDRVWRTESVSEFTVSSRIAELQEALGDGVRDPSYIETVPERGYRLAAAVALTEPSATVTPFPAVRAQPERPVFVAREAELESLDGFLQQALAGKGRVAFVTGEAGTGKTALVQELVRRAQDAHGDLVAAVGICSAQNGIGDAYAPWRQLLALLTGDLESGVASGSMTAELGRRLWGAAPLAAEAVVESGRDLVGTLIPGAALLARAEAAAPAGATWLPQLRELVERKASLPPDAALRQAAVFMQAARVLGAVARRRPLLLVLEDLHWADAGSIALLFHLGREVAAHPILVLGTYRPTDVALGRGGERHPLEPAVAELKGLHGQVTVELGQVGDRGFVGALVDSEPNRLGEGFREGLFRQTAGHALFTVEVLRTMQDQGLIVHDPEGRWVEGADLDWGALPERVEGVIGARIERLTDQLRDLLTIASVEGKEFTAEVVARVRDMDSRETIRLLSRELEQRHRLVSARGVHALTATSRLSSFGFSHVLFQRYLYTNLNEVERVQFHEDVGNVLEALYGDDTEEIAIRLARHFEEAGIIDKAVHYLHQAGERSTRMTASQEAIGHLRKATELLATLPESDDRDRTELTLQFAMQGPWSAVQGWSCAEVARAVDRAQDLAERVGDDVQKAWVLYLIGSLYTCSGRIPEIEGVAERLDDLARSMGDEAFGLMAGALMAYFKTYTGRSKEGRAGWEAVIAQYDLNRHHWIAHAGGGDPAVLGFGHVAWTLARMGFLDQCLDWVEQGRELAERVGHHLTSCHPLGMGVTCHLYRHELEQATRLVDETIALASEHGFPHWIMWARAWQGAMLIMQGEHEAGVTLIAEQTEGLRQIGMEFGRVGNLCALSSGLLGCGRVEEALATLDEALEVVDCQGPHFSEAEVHRHRGEVLQTTGALPEAEAAYLEAIEVARTHEAKYFELLAASGLARMWQGQGRRRDARELLAPVYDWFTEGLDTAPLEEARALLEELGDGDQNE